jgi:hypothetical protein
MKKTKKKVKKKVEIKPYLDDTEDEDVNLTEFIGTFDG